MMERAMTTAATCETGALARSDVIACIFQLRALAVRLAGDRQRADDLVRETIVQTFTAVKRPRDGISLQVRMFTALRRLHYGALGQSIDVAARQPEQPSTKGNGVGSDELLRIFRRLRDEQREALILAVASGLSYEQAAEICDCQIDTIRSRVSEARREISVMSREASLGKINFELLADQRRGGPRMPSSSRRSWRRQETPHRGGPVQADRALRSMGTSSERGCRDDVLEGLGRQTPSPRDN
jgi:RNA polymerase sigma-70 factor (ECF subfamily)